MRSIAGILALAVLAVAQPAMAQRAPMQWRLPGDGPGAVKLPMGQDRKYSPPMDVPPYAWMTYYRDVLGRPTFVSPDCLGSVDLAFARSCVLQAIERHDRLAADRTAEINRVIQERVQEEDAARAAENAERGRQARAERERQASIDAAARARELHDAAAARRAANDPATYARSIHQLRLHVSYLQRIINREHRVGGMSGYVDKSVLYRAAQGIVADEDQIDQIYRQYRAHGGRQSLFSVY